MTAPDHTQFITLPGMAVPVSAGPSDREYAPIQLTIGDHFVVAFSVELAERIVDALIEAIAEQSE